MCPSTISNTVGLINDCQLQANFLSIIVSYKLISDHNVDDVTNIYDMMPA